MNKRRESDSGLCSEGESQAVRQFFDSYVPRLEVAVKHNSSSDFEDPSIDLGDFGKAPPSPILQRHRNSGATFISDRKDPVLDELENIIGQIEKKNGYSQKLANIMLKSLRQTLGDDMYKFFLQGRLPVNWLPIVKFNNDNTPYVEFLLKSDISDQDPDAQLSDYKMEHIAHSKYIVDYLHNSTKQVKLSTAPTVQAAPQRSRQSAPPPNPLRAPPQKASRLSEGHQRRNFPDPIVSTPLSQRKRPTPQTKVGADLNDSKRILPSRACKLNSTITYSK